MSIFAGNESLTETNYNNVYGNYFMAKNAVLWCLNSQKQQLCDTGQLKRAQLQTTSELTFHLEEGYTVYVQLYGTQHQVSVKQKTQELSYPILW